MILRKGEGTRAVSHRYDPMHGSGGATWLICAAIAAMNEGVARGARGKFWGKGA
jgi:hypothetical protein